MMETETPVVLIDVRDAESAAAAHIQGAVSIPAAQLADAKDRFPSLKKAPVVLYGADTSAALESFRLVRDWGYMNTTVLIDGFEGWQKGDLPVATGETASEIVYVPKPKAGTVDIASFAKAVDSKTTDVVILDVRTDDETEAGKIAGAIAIPAEEVVERLGEIPMDKQVYIHCSTGVRAEMAYVALKEKGYKASFLDANIVVTESGGYDITEKE